MTVCGPGCGTSLAGRRWRVLTDALTDHDRAEMWITFKVFFEKAPGRLMQTKTGENRTSIIVKSRRSKYTNFKIQVLNDLIKLSRLQCHRFLNPRIPLQCLFILIQQSLERSNHLLLISINSLLLDYIPPFEQNTFQQL